jgi:hypothetical protein
MTYDVATMPTSPQMPAAVRRPLWVWVVAGIALAGAGFWVWDDLIKPHVVIKRFGVVAEGKVYRSGALTPATLAKAVREHGIRTEVDLGTFRDDPAGELRMAKAATALGITRYSFHLYGDGSGDPNEYLQALRLINDPKNQPVLVHCGAGTHRTGCAVVLYRTIIEGKNFDDALREAENFDYVPGKHLMVKKMLDQWREPIAGAMQSGAATVEGAAPLAGTVEKPVPTTIPAVSPPAVGAAR